VEQLEAREVFSAGAGFFAAGADVGSRGTATLYNPDGSARFSVLPFGDTFNGGVRVAVADVSGDGTADLVAAAGPGAAPLVKVYSGVDGAEVGSFAAFESSFFGGVNVSAADLTGDGVAEIIVSPDAGGGPRVRVLGGPNGSEVLADFYGLDDPSFRGGVRVAVGDVNGDGTADLVVGAGAGGGSRVAVYDGVGLLADPAHPTRIVNDFLVFDSSLRDGVNLAVGDVNGDGYADLAFGAGAGGSPRVVVWDSKSLVASGGADQVALLNTFAFTPDSRSGARVAAGDLDGDGVAEILTGPGPGVDGVVRAYSLNGGVESWELVTPSGASSAGLFVAIQGLPPVRQAPTPLTPLPPPPPANTAPRISDVANQTVAPGGTTGTLAFTVSDAETPVGLLTVTASSSNTTLVPPSGITFGGSRGNRTVTLTPVAGQSGATTITLTVTDAGGLTATDTFTITVPPASPPPPPPPPPNTAPQISDVGNQTVPQGSTTGALAFAVSDAQTAAGSLTVTAVSSNATLVPSSGITLGGAGGNRTVTVTPAAGQFGTAIITLTVTDAGGLTATDTFTVTVPPPPPNTAPGISDVGNQTVAQGGSTGALAFAVSDVQTAAGSLTVTAVSSNTTLVPPSGITLGGAGGNRTVTVTPAAGQFGTATITLTVTDAGGLTATDTFTVTVPPPPPNTAPQVSDVANQTVPQGGATGALSFTVSDAETPVGSLTVTANSSNATLVPTSGITLGGAGGNRTVTVTPTAGQFGTATITLTVTDAGGLTATDTFTVTVPPPPPNTAPNISNVGNQTVPQGGNTGSIPFTVSDAETAASGLTVTVSSSNTALVPQSGITMSGSGQDRTVAITPTAGQSGTTTITLTVTDAGGLTATDTFTVTVPPASPPPPAVASSPRLLLTSSELADLRQQVANNTPTWQAFKARLDRYLTAMVGTGAYQGSQLAWIADYALGYQALKDSDPARASAYADKAIAVMKSGLRDFQLAGQETRQFLARGDGTTTSFVLPNADLIPSTVRVFIGPVWTQAVVRNTTYRSDPANYYSRFLKVSNTSDGTADYAEGVDWAHNSDLRNDQVDWALPGAEPANGSTYYVTMSTGFGATNWPYTLNGTTVTIKDGAGNPLAIGSDKAVWVEYIYGTPSADGSTLAYQQTGAGDGGFNSILKDNTYPARYLGKFVSIAYDWLYDYAGLTPALKAEASSMLVKWADYEAKSGYLYQYPTSNYGTGGYVSNMFTALALSGGRDPNGDRLLTQMQAYRQNNVLPALQNPDASLRGGFWSEGWSYGDGAAQNILQAGLAFEAAGLGVASAERAWSAEVTRGLLSAQSTRSSIYNGGDWFAYPAPLPGNDLFTLLAEATTDATIRSYDNYVLQNRPQADTNNYIQMLYRDPTAPAAFWADLPLQHRAEGTGLVTARADWSYNSTWMSVQFSNLLAADHQSYSPGQLQIQRGADDLLVNTNAIANVQIPNLKSSLSNLIAIDDNGDRVQSYRWNMAFAYGTPGIVTTAYEATADHVYVAGDYRAAYSPQSAPGTGGPASELTRQVVYLRPDFIIVHDRATTIKNEYPKQLQWHFLNAPTVTGNSWVAAAGSSKLFGATFSSQPITTTTQPVTVHNKTVHRVATNNAAPSASVRYTTALQTATSGVTSMVSTQQVVSTDGRVEGVQMGDEVVLFGRDGLVNPAGGAITYTATGSATLNHFLTDLQPGRAYQLEVNGAPAGSVTATDQGTLSFRTTATGTVTVKLS
jgi:hypothetical protein